MLIKKYRLNMDIHIQLYLYLVLAGSVAFTSTEFLP